MTIISEWLLCHILYCRTMLYDYHFRMVTLCITLQSNYFIWLSFQSGYSVTYFTVELSCMTIIPEWLLCLVLYSRTMLYDYHFIVVTRSHTLQWNYVICYHFRVFTPSITFHHCCKVIRPWLNLSTGGNGHSICMGDLRVSFSRDNTPGNHTETNKSSFFSILTSKLEKWWSWMI